MIIEETDFTNKYLNHLNENQLRAVRTVDGPILLLAVPGSGKTTVLINRLGYMIFTKGINPDNILALTYNRAAVTDMSRRFVSIFGEDNGGIVEFRTINGICQKIILRYANMIGKPAFSLCDDEKAIGKILTDILAKNLSEYPTESDVKAARTLITYCKNMLLTEDEIQKLGADEGIPLLDIYKSYNQYLRENQLMDYDDQMVYAYRMLKGSPELLQYYRDTYKYICVDEAQDTSKVQHIIIGMLAGENGNLFMVGDEDQSIYGFRAAYPEALLNFEKDHPKAQVLIMDQNYRSNANIVSAADRFIQRNKDRHKKHMVSTREAESDIRIVDMKTRASQYSYLVKVASGCNSETAVLYRDNESVLPLIDLLDRQHISYRIKSVDMSFFTHRSVIDVINMLKFALDPTNADLFMRIYFKCQTFLKKNQAEELCRISAERGIPILSAVAYADGINGMVKGKCRALQTNLGSMKKENPGKALFRIENPMGYGEYLERNNIDDNKLYILKQLANNEMSITGFLARIEYLQNLLKNSRPNYDCPFILSTIHSSKGLEYDQVYLMDVCDGVFPSEVVRSSSSSTPQERKNFEEERRLFYVGMTRAKNELHIFKLADRSSTFLKDLTVPVKDKSEKSENTVVVKQSRSFDNWTKPVSAADEKLVSDYELIIGERVIQKMNGSGTISDVSYDAKGKANKFEVTYDSGDTKTYAFPLAFKMGMKLESGEEISISSEKKAPAVKPVAPKKTVKPSIKKNVSSGKKNSYAYWASAYPEYVVIKREGAFWTCRGESAKTLNEILGYRLGGNPANPVTGSPNLDPIIAGLNHNAVSYIVIEDGEIIEQKEY